jgi:integrase
MPRVSKGPRYYDSKKAFYATISGERTRLCDGPDNKANRKLAQERYDNLTKACRAQVDGDRSECWVVLDAYLLHLRTRVAPRPVAPSSYRIAELACRNFCELHGKVRVCDLRAQHVQDWLARRREEKRVCPRTGHGTTWGDATAKTNLAAIVAGFKWAATDGELISVSPFERRGQKAPWPEVNYLGRKLAVTDAEHAALLAQARRSRGSFGLLLECLHHSGARPAEMYLVTAAEWNQSVQGFEIDPADPKNIGRLKTRRVLRKRGRKRIVRVPDHLVPALQELMGKHPEGPIFRKGRDGEPWGKSGVARRFKRLVQATGRAAAGRGQGSPVRASLTLYSYRHGFVTRWLRAGGSPMALCELLNTSLEMLRQHYSHLFEEHDYLLAELNDFSRRSAPGGPGPHTASPSPADAPPASAAPEPPRAGEGFRDAV